MSPTIERAELARSFYDSTTIAISVAATSHGDPLCALRRSLGARFSKLTTQALADLGPHLIADVEAGRATLGDAAHVALARVEGDVRRRRVGDRAMGAGAAS